MAKSTSNKKTTGKEETKTDLKKETVVKEGVKKGYNEKNPVQPQGAFKPDSAEKDN